jgi:hypothetical protein
MWIGGPDLSDKVTLVWAVVEGEDEAKSIALGLRTLDLQTSRSRERKKNWIGSISRVIFLTDQGKVKLSGKRTDFGTESRVQNKLIGSGKEIYTTSHEIIRFGLTAEELHTICSSDAVEFKLYGKKSSEEYSLSEKHLDRLKVLYNKAIDSSRFIGVEEKVISEAKSFEEIVDEAFGSEEKTEKPKRWKRVKVGVGVILALYLLGLIA